ncbi:MAG TPA: Rnase Y domain-containing protein, partial [Ferruginibacter sp.]|nr:Rnase Y domain-containing protein [Ferruginibacter sp.]
MEPIIIYVIIGVAALILGLILGKLVFAKNTQKRIEEAEQQAQKIIADGQVKAETLKKEKLLEAKEKFVQLKADHDREVMQR